MASACCGLAFIGVLGIFNRITFPAFLVAPAIQLLRHLFTRRLRIPLLLVAGVFTLAIAVTTDTEIYAGVRPELRNLRDTTIFTPLNNLLYNLNSENLAKHGLHPFWQHFAVNELQLLGPAIPLVWFSSRRNMLFWSAIVGIAALSCFPHQEPRFLLPAVPLLLASVKMPKRFTRAWVASWIIFNVVLGILFGSFHQGGVVPAQRWLATQEDIGKIYWWKTYSPPLWLDGHVGDGVETKDLMGLPEDRLLSELFNNGECERDKLPRSLLVAPASATFLDKYLEGPSKKRLIATVRLRELWRYGRHVGLDDLDFAEDGIWLTLRRVLGRRGLVVWQVNKKC
ncbi:alpha 1,2 mannosyltransferase [Vermiconidia calcicola]|uniref:Alpha 1,2 mannosyltransferase n=1 Tax=Vermiconidia calcicola TaxID=1690605 RepID=A0ACC3NFE5_9PEZI|nr:alpha 1,2 mannosyltransferase [Vermiconidia calcicola]